MKEILLSPPIAFLIILVTILLLSYLFSKLAFGKSERISPPYSCGEEFTEHLIQPDYSQFFPYAFFFTILHVVALVIATIPAETPQTFVIATVYVLVAAIGLTILLRR